MTDKEDVMDKEIVEAVRERVRMADGWSKSTGYPPADYFDTMMDLRRLLGVIGRRADNGERAVIEAAKKCGGDNCYWHHVAPCPDWDSHYRPALPEQEKRR